ncbi:MAG: tryptophan--tRNA ligase [Fastidiosipilaceae bacterium]|jgi:tryptophanyl-tRNA synthetase
MERKKVVSGIRPTGDIHIGNYFGALANWVKLQEEYDCNYFVADWHALTTGYADTADLNENIYHLMADLLAVGLDLEKCNVFLQSLVPAHSELHLILSMITPLSWLERCPTYKAQLEQLSDRDITTYGFLGYPCLMTSDIVLYKCDYVPVGEDQLPHLELAREIVRRFHHLYQTDIFVEPQALLTKAKVLPGTDGRKMSKSYGNTIAFADDPDVVKKKVMSMKTDPARIRKDDPGHPEICTVYAYHELFNDKDRHAEIGRACRAGEIGCVACKKELQTKIEAFHTPIHEKRTKLLKDNRTQLKDYLIEGARKATLIADATMEEVRQAMRIKFS